MPELITPDIRWRNSWLEARDEWAPGAHQDGAGLREFDDVETEEGFAAWLDRLRRESDESISPPEGWVHATFWWIVDGDTYLGAITLRHELNEFLLREGGHIGYSVRPSARRRGLASWALQGVLTSARERGLDRVLITCDDDNVGSARTIEGAGGVLEDVRALERGLVRRYWINLTAE